jgi:hypothetical protein
LPEVTLRGRVEHRNRQYARHAAACLGAPSPGAAQRRRLLADPAVAITRSSSSRFTAGRQPNAWEFRARRSLSVSPRGITLISRTIAER